MTYLFFWKTFTRKKKYYIMKMSDDMDNNYIDKVKYLQEVITKTRNDKINLYDLKKATRYFGFKLITGEDNKCYYNVLTGNTIVVNKDYDDNEKIVYYYILLGYSLIYLKNNNNPNNIYYTKKTIIIEEDKRLAKCFAEDLLLNEKNLENILKENAHVSKK